MQALCNLALVDAVAQVQALHGEANEMIQLVIQTPARPESLQAYNEDIRCLVDLQLFGRGLVFLALDVSERTPPSRTLHSPEGNTTDHPDPASLL